MTLRGIAMADLSPPHLAPLLALAPLAQCGRLLARDSVRSERVLALVATFAARAALASAPLTRSPGP